MTAKKEKLCEIYYTADEQQGMRDDYHKGIDCLLDLHPSLKRKTRRQLQKTANRLKLKVDRHVVGMNIFAQSERSRNNVLREQGYKLLVDNPDDAAIVREKYQELGYKVLALVDGYTLPQIVRFAKKHGLMMARPQTPASDVRPSSLRGAENRSVMYGWGGL